MRPGTLTKPMLIAAETELSLSFLKDKEQIMMKRVVLMCYQGFFSETENTRTGIRNMKDKSTFCKMKSQFIQSGPLPVSLSRCLSIYSYSSADAPYL